MGIRHSRAAMVIALAAMLLRALLPMGWMPNPAGFAQSPLIICVMDGSSGLDLDQSAAAPDAMGMSDMDMSPMDMAKMDMQGQDRHHGQQQSSEPCPFAAAPHIAATAGLMSGPAPLSSLARLAERPARETGLALGRAYRPQSPRAPPSLA